MPYEPRQEKKQQTFAYAKTKTQINYCAADQRLCFCYIDSAISVLSQSEISSQISRFAKLKFDAICEVNSIFTSSPEVINLFSCSTQLSIKFILLINVKLSIVVGIFTFMSILNDWLW